MKRFLGAAAVSIGMIAAVACGRSESPKPSQTGTTSASLVPQTSSCDRVEESGVCEEYARSGTLEKSLCEGYKGKFTLAPCRAQGLVGTCRISAGEVKRYHGSRYSPAEAKADCESPVVRGTFDQI